MLGRRFGSSTQLTLSREDSMTELDSRLPDHEDLAVHSNPNEVKKA